MKERPILFSGPMVRALLDGTKTQTRRAVKWRDVAPGLNLSFSGLEVHSYAPGLFTLEGRSRIGIESRSSATRCPYGAPGDRLWVRETCRGEELDGGLDGVRYLADDAFRPIEDTPKAAIDWLTLHTYRGHSGTPIGPKVPGIHMPRWASRITLEVTGVRVERLQAISEADALAEGVRPLDPPTPPRSWGGPNRFTIRIGDIHCNAPTAAEVYGMLWESINDAGSWDANPWVWVVEFKRLP